MDCILGKCSVGVFRDKRTSSNRIWLKKALTLKPLGENFLRDIHQHHPTHYPPEKVKGPSQQCSINLYEVMCIVTKEKIVTPHQEENNWAAVKVSEHTQPKRNPRWSGGLAMPPEETLVSSWSWAHPGIWPPTLSYYAMPDSARCSQLLSSHPRLWLLCLCCTYDFCSYGNTMVWGHTTMTEHYCHFSAGNIKT